MKQQPFGRQMYRIVDHLPKKPQETVRPMWRTVWGTLQRTFWEAKASCCKEAKKTNVSFCPKTFTMAESLKAQTCHFAPRPLLWLKVSKLTLLRKMQKRVEELGDKFKEVMGEPSTNLLAPKNGSAPEDQRDHETCTTLVKPWWNLGETLAEPW